MKIKKKTAKVLASFFFQFRRVRSFTWRSSAALLGEAVLLYWQKQARKQQQLST
jgi:hypothetical protein